MSTYTYSVNSNFDGVPPDLQFISSQIASQIAGPALTKIGFLGDSLHISFDTTLTSPQIASLNSICVPGTYRLTLTGTYNSNNIGVNFVPQGTIDLSSLISGTKNGEINMTFGNSSDSYVTYKSTSYKEICQMYYSGSTFYNGSPTFFSVIVSTNSSTSTGSCYLRIMDLTNNKNIASLSILNTINGIGTLYSTSTFSNISSSPAIWSISIIGRPSGSTNISTNLHSVYLRLI